MPMPRPALAIALALVLSALPAAADGPVFRGALPAPERLATAGPGALAAMVQAVVIGQNCPARRTTDGEWALLNGSADLVAAHLGLDPQRYDDRFWRPAFALLDQPAGCARHGWAVPKALGWLRSLGGTTGE
jgi:hypothetical protein